jgi:hypothetical protein
MTGTITLREKLGPREALMITKSYHEEKLTLLCCE